MPIIDGILTEFALEAKTTRRVLEAVPEDKFEFKPHEKSMSLGHLAGHIAENPTWAQATLAYEVLDIDTMDYTPFVATTSAELLAFFDKNMAEAVESMVTATDEQLLQTWKMTKGGHTVLEMPRVAVLRTMILNHTVHHRGQLSVYLRLVGARVPSIYGPTADEPM